MQETVNTDLGEKLHLCQPGGMGSGDHTEGVSGEKFCPDTTKSRIGPPASGTQLPVHLSRSPWESRPFRAPK